MTPEQVTKLIVFHELSVSLSHALLCLTPDSDPVDVLSAASRNAAASIAMELACAAEGV
jgi:hypothetical protein